MSQEFLSSWYGIVCITCGKEGVSIHVGYIPSLKPAEFHVGGSTFYYIHRLAALIVCIYNLVG